MGEKFKICLGCMMPKTEEDTCPYCGYQHDSPYLPMYIAPGTVLNERYLVGKLLKYNGEGANYIAYDIVTNRRVLVKEYMPDTLCTRVKGSPVISVNQSNLAQYKTFMSEFTELNKILSKMRTLNHINPALELFAANNTTYVIFDHIDGETLDEYLDKSGEMLSWDEVRRLLPPIFTTLSLVHNAGLIHRGISPETLMYTSKNELKLTGFCISSARTVSAEIAPEIFAGYAAPEQYTSSNWQGTWTDVYGISAVVYRMLTGKTPIESISRVGSDDLIEPSLINNTVPKNVSSVIMSGLKLSGDMRIQTVTELVTKLFEQAEDIPDESSTITIPRQTGVSQIKKPVDDVKRKAKLNKIRIPLIVFVVIVTVLGVAALIFLSLLNDDSDDNNSGDESYSSYESIFSSETLPVETTKPTVQTGASMAESMELPSFMDKRFDLIKDSETYKDWIVFTAEYEYNEQYPKGQIFDQSIKEGTTVNKGQEIKLKVSLGPQVVSVPDFYGKTEKEYFETLDSAGIKYERAEEANSGFLDGYIIRTSKDIMETVDVANGEILVVYVCNNALETIPVVTN